MQLQRWVSGQRHSPEENGSISVYTNRSVDSLSPQTAYKSVSSSVNSFANNAIVFLTGSAVVISTPASRKVSSGNFDPPDLRKPRYFSTALISPLRTRWESVTAAESPVAYL